jgi:DNA-binding beta-propeller fold protein YncE
MNIPLYSIVCALSVAFSFYIFYLEGVPNALAETYNFVSSWGTAGPLNGQVNHPSDVAMDEDSKFIYITDLDNNRIEKFSDTGTFVTAWGKKGSADGQFLHPGDLTVGGGFVYVSDILNNRIQKFTTDGKFVSSWGSFGKTPGKFNHPGALALGFPGDSLYITDIGNSRIQKFTINGVFIGSWGSEGTKDGQFERPAGLDYDAAGGRLYVADSKNNRIQVFDKNGQFLAKWGSIGVGDGQFDRPTDIKVDSLRKLIYVADSDNERIQVFDKNGQFLAKWGSKGTASGQFVETTGITINPNKDLVYIVDKFGNKIHIYSVSGGNKIGQKVPTTPIPLPNYPSDKNSLYYNTNLGIQMNYPSDWTFIESQSGLSVVFKPKTIPDITKLGPTLEVQLIKLPQTLNLSLQKYVSSNMKSISESSKTVSTNETQSVVISGQPAYEIFYVTSHDGTNIPIMKIFSMFDHSLYVMTYTGSSLEFTRNLAIAQQIGESARFINIS